MIVPTGPELVYRPNLSEKVGLSVYGCKMKHAGYAHQGMNAVTLRMGLCDELEHPSVSVPTANAIFVLAHETGHLRLATNDENRANDYAFSHFRLLARKLGFSRWQARKLYRLNPYN